MPGKYIVVEMWDEYAGLGQSISPVLSQVRPEGPSRYLKPFARISRGSLHGAASLAVSSQHYASDCRSCATAAIPSGAPITIVWQLTASDQVTVCHCRKALH